MKFRETTPSTGIRLCRMLNKRDRFSGHARVDGVLGQMYSANRALQRSGEAYDVKFSVCRV